jgi:hypothetical protein
MIILYCSCQAVFVGAQKIELMNHLPEQYNSYKVTDLLAFEGEALFDYINGGAELYLSYGLVGMTGCKYNGEGLPQITVEVYEMTEPKNAFGVYTQNRDKEEHDYGQGSQSFNDFILFWKDRYFVVVSSQRSTPESTAVIRHFASLVDKAIPGEGQPPPIINSLPGEGLAPGGFLYFHHYIWLNAYLFIANFNIVNITHETDAVLAKYGPPDARCYLLLVEYPDTALAETASQQLTEKYAPEWTVSTPIIQLEDGTWFLHHVKGNKLVAIFHGSSREQVENLYQSIF